MPWSGARLAVAALADLPDALRRRVIRGWLLAGGATGLTDGQIRAVDALVTAWRGQGGVAVGSAFRSTRLFAERRGEALRLRGASRSFDWLSRRSAWHAVVRVGA